jgi:hypothetical protein
MIESLIILIVGIMMVVVALSLSHTKKGIKRNGLNCEGMVFDFSYDPNSSFKIRYPIIRFVTHKQEWITELANIGFSFGLYKKGQKVSVTYNPENPKEFIINSKINTLIVYTILIAGVLLISFEVYQLFK